MGTFDVHKVNFFSPQLLSIQCMVVENETQKLAIGRFVFVNIFITLYQLLYPCRFRV